MSKKLLQAAAGNAAGESLYVEDVFSTYLYEGNGSTQTITNGIDLDGEGGLVWSKTRTEAYSHGLYDTERGATKELKSDATTAESTDNGVTAFNSDGYNVGARFTTNNTGDDYVSWTFRKAKKFFDVVTYTGDGVSGREIPHNLGATVGCIITKRLDSASNNWSIYHRKASATVPQNVYLTLNNTDGVAGSTAYWNDTAPTDTVFTVGDGNTNYSGNPYVAYVFAHDAGGFGDDGSESIIKCGSFTVDGSGYSPNVELGFEPQWVLIKPATTTGNWLIVDTMRGWVNRAAADDANLRPNTSEAENLNDIGYPYSTGFYAGYRGGAGSEWIYIAIRRPMKTPESGTEVFTPLAVTVPPYSVTAGFPVDLALFGKRSGTNSNRWLTLDRLRGGQPALITSSTAAENTTYASSFASNTQFTDGWSSGGFDNFYALFKRATGFFDVVAYTGTGSATTQSHNLGVEPELMIVKRRSSSGSDWWVYNSPRGATKSLRFTNDAEFTLLNIWNNTEPTSSVFTIGADSSVNGGGSTYIAYLFATLAGVSKVGSYTGTGSNVDVDCGFSAGARFILIKRTDSTGDWYVWDSERGIVSGNDPYLLLNSTAAEVTSTDYIDPLSSGFTVTSSAPAALNASGGNYIFLAIA